MAVTLSPAAAWAAQEEICNSAAVIFCDNFEDRAPGASSLYVPGPGLKSPPWGDGSANNDAANIQVIDVSTNPGGVFQGSRALQLHYPASTDGVGFLNPSFPSAYSEVYLRFYTKWGSTFQFSTTATKDISFTNTSPIPQSFYIFWGHFGPDIKMYNQDTDTVYPPNVGGGVFNATLNQWYCFEFHYKLETSAGAGNGILEAWIDGVRRWNYTGQNLGYPGALAASAATGFLLSGYWNTAQFHPEMYRWHDNFVASTQRIGCISGTASPSAPTATTLQ